MDSRDRAPANYTTPSFPSLAWPPQQPQLALYRLIDIWRFTLLWTLFISVCVHLAAAAIALAMHMGKTRPENWKFLWAVPLVYVVVAGFEALLAGSIVGLIVGACYTAGHFTVSTWIPFIWGWINVLVLIVSSFSIQGGL